MGCKRYQVGVVGGDLGPWRELLASCLVELHAKGEVADVITTLREIERRTTARPQACRVWIVLDEDIAGTSGARPMMDCVAAWLVTDVSISNDTGLPVLVFWLGWIRPGENAAPMEEALSRMDNEARRLGCATVQASSGRPGYGRWIRRYGFEQRTVVYERPVKAIQEGAM